MNEGRMLSKIGQRLMTYRMDTQPQKVVQNFDLVLFSGDQFEVHVHDCTVRQWPRPMIEVPRALVNLLVGGSTRGHLVSAPVRMRADGC
jgi:hypothetical protein